MNCTEDQKMKAKMQHCSGYQDTINKTKYCEEKQKQHNLNKKKIRPVKHFKSV